MRVRVRVRVRARVRVRICVAASCWFHCFQTAQVVHFT